MNVCCVIIIICSCNQSKTKVFILKWQPFTLFIFGGWVFSGITAKGLTLKLLKLIIESLLSGANKWKTNGKEIFKVYDLAGIKYFKIPLNSDKAKISKISRHFIEYHDKYNYGLLFY